MISGTARNINPQRFSGRTALVTGAAGGIGQAVCERLGSEGSDLVLVDVSKDKGESAAASLRAKGYNASFIFGDMSDYDSVRAAVDLAVSKHDGLDILVNNAAVFYPSAFEDMEVADMEKIFSVNVVGALVASQGVAKSMASRGGGAIVNLSSILAIQGSSRMVAYSASKGAISAMTRSMAVALADDGVRVNAVAPGTIVTPSSASVTADNPGQNEQVLARTPLRRLGSPEEIASVVAFLASEDAAFITGQILYVEGGRLALGYLVPGAELAGAGEGVASSVEGPR